MNEFDRFQRRAEVWGALRGIVNKDVLELFAAEKPLRGFEGPQSECICFVYRSDPNRVVARFYYQTDTPKWRHVERDFVKWTRPIRQGLEHIFDG